MNPLIYVLAAASAVAIVGMFIGWWFAEKRATDAEKAIDLALRHAQTAQRKADAARAMLADAKADVYQARRESAIARERLTRMTTETVPMVLRDDVTVEMQAVISAEVDQFLNDLRKDS